MVSSAPSKSTDGKVIVRTGTSPHGQGYVTAWSISLPSNSACDRGHRSHHTVTPTSCREAPAQKI